MIKKLLLPLLLVLTLLTACGSGGSNNYQRISQRLAKDMMDENPEAVILDVREQYEYEEGHIPGAVLLPVDTITADTAGGLIPDLETIIMVYCRSGNRSQTAAGTLARLGYKNVFEFGGISSWPYDIEADTN